MTNAQTVAPPRFLARAALGWLVAGLAIAVYVEITGAAVEDPVRSTFSEYVHTEQGARLVGVAMLMVGFAALSVFGALGHEARHASRLVAVFGVGLVLLAVFVATFVPATGARAYSGLAERVLLAVDLVILVVMARRALR